jgi:hypothetical protein
MLGSATRFLAFPPQGAATGESAVAVAALETDLFEIQGDTDREPRGDELR